jgi:large subunit ribosomal protein L30
MAKVKITLVKSLSKRSPRQRATIIALGLGKISSSVEKELNPAIQGMIDKVKHIINVEQI